MKKSVLFFGALLIIVLGYYFLNNRKGTSYRRKGYKCWGITIT